MLTLAHKIQIKYSSVKIKPAGFYSCHLFTYIYPSTLYVCLISKT